jgi:streptogramin lyase
MLNEVQLRFSAEKITKVILLFIFIFIYNQTIAQVNQEWIANYRAEINSIFVDNNGNVYLTGGCEINNDNQICTIKYSSTGVQQWIQFYNGIFSGGDCGNAIVVDKFGNVYITGYTWRGFSTFFNYCTIKYSSSGVQQWVQEYNGPNNYIDEATNISLDSNGNIFVTGFSFVDNYYIISYATIKYDSFGNVLWFKRYGMDTGTTPCGIVTDIEGNAYVSGYCGNCYTTIKYSPTGQELWVQTYGDGYQNAKSLTIDKEANVYVTGGGCEIGTHQSLDYITIKYSSNGIQQWVQRYNSPANLDDIANTISIDTNGNVYVCGTIKINSFGYNQFCTIKYSKTGLQEWVRCFGNYSNEQKSLSVEPNGTVYIAGWYSNNVLSADYIIIKYNTSGTQQWITTYGGPTNHDDYLQAMTIDNNNNIYVTGISEGTNCTIKYSQQIGIQPISSEIPKSFSLSQNYPNPFNPSTKIKFDIPICHSCEGRNPLIALKVYDILGKEIAIIVNEQLKPGSYEVEFDGSNYPSGVYFYKLLAGDYTESKRMVLIK